MHALMVQIKELFFFLLKSITFNILVISTIKYYTFIWIISKRTCWRFIKYATLGHRLTQHYIDKTYYLLGFCNCDLRESFCLFTTSIEFVYYLMILSILWLFRMKPRLADPSFRPQRNDILATMDNFLNLLRIRYSSALFRLRTANAIQVRYFKFHHYVKLLHQLVHRYWSS